MTIVLGIHDGTHDAGAALVQNGEIIAACDEERFLRKKGVGGWPSHSISACLDSAGISLTDVNAISFAGFVNPNPVLRLFREQQNSWRLDDGKFYVKTPSLQRKFSDWLQFKSPFPYLHNPSNRYKTIVQKILKLQCTKRLQWSGPIELFEHHHCHAASAYFQSGFNQSLVVIVDGLGDGLCTTIWEGKESSLKLIHKMEFPNSYGLLYSFITGYLGFKPFRHEGKITGLSAHGNKQNIPIDFPFTGSFPNRLFTQRFPLYNWLSQFDNFNREDICAWLQDGLEKEVIGLIQHFIGLTGVHNLSMAGGVFANVRLNQSIVEQCNIDNMFVFPNMGDAGLSVGSALCFGNKIDKWQPAHLKTVFLGPTIKEEQIQKTLRTSGLPFQKLINPINTIVELLVQGKIVAICKGRMEYGPRALGNRSILADPSIPSVIERLNNSLQRSDFMPFAPILSVESIDSCLQWNDCFEIPTQFMTTTVQSKPYLIKKCPSIVHVDGTLRPQIVDQQKNPFLWGVITSFEEKTNRPALINTSFNIHEEPIVSTPKEAIRAFNNAKLDALILGNYLVTPR
jgi:carbamoyltransferase